MAHALADALEAHREELIELADLETALGPDRLSAELARTTGQTRFYGDVASRVPTSAWPSTTPAA